MSAPNSAAAVTESGRPLSDAPGVRVLASEKKNEIVCETGSGEYRFETRVPLNNQP